MAKADDIRQYCKAKCLEARRKGDKTITFCSGDVHKALNLNSSLPAVCAAIGADEFERMCNVTRLCVDGPLNGSTTLFVFKLL